MKDLFYRLGDDGNAVVLDSDGYACTRISEADGGHTVYPVDSSLSCAHEHVNGIILTVEDAEKLGIEEDPSDPGSVG